MQRLLLLTVPILAMFPGDSAPRVSAAPIPRFDSADVSDAGNHGLAAGKKKSSSAKKKSAKRKKSRRKSSPKKRFQKRRKPAKKNTGRRNTSKNRSKGAKKRPNRNTQRKKPGEARPRTTTKPKTKSKTKKDGDDVRVKVLTWKQTKSLVALQKGKVVVVDVWANWCAPCKREFPHLVSLQKSFPKTVVCLSLNVDNDGEEETAPAKTKEKILAFLKKMNSRLINVISRDAFESVLSSIGTDSLPTILVYGRDGKLARKFNGANLPKGDKKLSYEKHIIPLVKKLLAK